MEPAEAIVNAWLQMKGYFTMNNVKVGSSRKEIDILALKMHPSGGSIENKMHVEMTVAVNRWGKWKEEEVEKYLQDKFVNEDTVECIKEYLGADYKKLLVMDDESCEEVGELAKVKGIECFKFSQVLSEIKQDIQNKSYGDDTRRFLGLVFKHDR